MPRSANEAGNCILHALSYLVSACLSEVSRFPFAKYCRHGRVDELLRLPVRFISVCRRAQSVTDAYGYNSAPDDFQNLPYLLRRIFLVAQMAPHSPYTMLRGPRLPAKSSPSLARRYTLGIVSLLAVFCFYRLQSTSKGRLLPLSPVHGDRDFSHLDVALYEDAVHDGKSSRPGRNKRSSTIRGDWRRR
jgi:hypothetical protein